MFEGMAELARIPAGARLAAALEAVDSSCLDGGAQVDVLCAWARLSAYVEAQLLTEMVAAADRSVGVGFDSDDVAFALKLPRMVAARQVALGRDLVRRLPDVHAALAEGQIDLARARVFAEQLAPVTDDGLARQIAAKLLPPAADWTASQLRARLQRAILAADADAATQRYERSVRERRVSLQADPDTTATLSAMFLPPQRAAAAFERVDAVARGIKQAGDARTLDQLRADVLLDLLQGVEPQAAPIGRQGVVELLVPLATLTGQGQDPGLLAGYGPVVADIARQVAAQRAAQAERDSAVQWRYRVYDEAGTLLHHGVTRARPHHDCPSAPGDGAVSGSRSPEPYGSQPTDMHGPAHTGSPAPTLQPRRPCPPSQTDTRARFPTAEVRRWITARDVTCRAPGCTAPARSCDVDHTEDHSQGGRTWHANLGLLCRHHHRLKHEGGHDLIQAEPGVFAWITPDLKVYSVEPDPPWF
jgi:hypothetical protein